MLKQTHITEQQMQDLYAYLQGRGEHADKDVSLSEKGAFNVIWYLQEVLRVLPDHWNCLRIKHEKP
jgi:hypothetical protein